MAETYTQAQIEEQEREIALSEKEYREETDPVMKRRKLVRVRNLKSVLRQMTTGKRVGLGWKITF